MKKAKFIIGRFQPFHKGHYALFQKAKEDADKVMIFIGSPNSSRTDKNPYTYMERFLIISKSISLFDMKNVVILPLHDCKTDEEWLEGLSNSLQEHAPSEEYSWNFVHTNKDSETSFSNNIVLNNLPNVISIPNNPAEIINATDIRKDIKEKGTVIGHPSLLPETIAYMTIKGYNDVFK